MERCSRRIEVHALELNQRYFKGKFTCLPILVGRAGSLPLYERRRPATAQCVCLTRHTALCGRSWRIVFTDWRRARHAWYLAARLPQAALDSAPSSVAAWAFETAAAYSFCCCWSTPLPEDCFTLPLLVTSSFARVCIYVVSDCALTLFVPSTSPSLTGWPEPGGGGWLQLAAKSETARGVAGKGGTAPLLISSTLAAAQVGVWLEWRAAAVGSHGTIWRSDGRYSPSPSRGLLDATLQTVPDLSRKRLGTERSGPTLTPLSTRPAFSAGAEEEEYLLLQRIASPAGLLTAAAGPGSMCVFVFVLLESGVWSLEAAGPPAQLSPKQFFTYQPLDVRSSYAQPLVRWYHLRLLTRSSFPDGIGRVCAFAVRAEPAWLPLWVWLDE